MQARRRFFLAIAAVLAAGVISGFVLAQPAAAASGDFVVSGRGYGHGSGMSQWGAWQAAREGAGYKKILAFYYPGTKLTTLDPGRTVKVRITRAGDSNKGYYRVSLRAAVTSATLVMHGSSGDSTRKLAAGDSVTVTHSGGKVTLDGIKGSWDWVEVRPASTSGRVAVAMRATSSISSVYKIEYWGKVRAEANGGSKCLRVFNTVLLERYLRGVAEVDPGWANAKLPSQYAPEAVKAQQVAARTYAVAHAGDAYLYDNTLDQVYLGYTWEATNPGVKAAVDATTGVILTRNGKPIAAYYCSSSGGYLSNTAWSNSGAPVYIVAKADPWSLRAPRKPWSTPAGWAWSCALSPESLTAKLKGVANVGTITKVEIIARDTSDAGSHAKTVRVTGSKGSATMTARVFKARLGLRSTLIVSVDKDGGATQAGATRYQQTDTRLDYAGSWETFKTGGASGGSYKRAATKGASVTVTFKGTYLAWIATKGTTLGTAYVSVDGKTAVKVDLARATTAYQQKVWSTGTLAAGSHTVKIWWYPANKVGKFISVDAFEVKGTLK